ncbi:Suppressor of SWI4 1-like protein [Aix galericulata]|nr:Suppressor of SWI4 1-like protein [Aix galericulata]
MGLGRWWGRCPERPGCGQGGEGMGEGWGSYGAGPSEVWGGGWGGSGGSEEGLGTPGPGPGLGEALGDRGGAGLGLGEAGREPGAGLGGWGPGKGPRGTEKGPGASFRERGGAGMGQREPKRAEGGQGRGQERVLGAMGEGKGPGPGFREWGRGREQGTGAGTGAGAGTRTQGTGFMKWGRGKATLRERGTQNQAPPGAQHPLNRGSVLPGGLPPQTKNQKKERAAAVQQAQQDFGTVPHSFVFHRGRVGKSVRQLILDVRRVMEPYTARALKVRKKNSMKDFVAVAGPLGVTHFLVFSKSTSSINFKLFRLPGGPTLTFKVMQYSLIKDVVSSLKRHRMHEQQFTQHPLLVLSNFGLQQIHVKLMASMFQNMFPSINVHKVRRVRLREPPPGSGNPPAGLVSAPNSSSSAPRSTSTTSRGVCSSATTPRRSSWISDTSKHGAACLEILFSPLFSLAAHLLLLFLAPQQREGGARGREQGPEEAAAGEIPQHEPPGGHQRAAGEVRAGPEGLGGAFLPAPTLLFLPGRDINLSESEAEQDGTHNILELPQAYAGRGNMKAQQSAVRLTEIGPRMTLQLVKVEEGLAQGNVLFHSFIHKTEQEVQEILARKEAKLKLKTERRQQQEAAVERKRQQREAHREKSLAGIRRKRQRDGDSDAEDPGAPEQQDAAGQSDESDAEYYRQELGQEPDEDLFPNRAKRPRGPSGSAVPRKRRRRSQQEQPGAPKPRPVARKKGPARTDSKPQGAAGQKTGRGSERPAREGQKHGPKRRGKLLARGKIIFRRPGHGKKGKR